MPDTVLDAKNKAVNIAEVSWLHRADSMVSHGSPLSTDWFGIAAQQRPFFLSKFLFLVAVYFILTFLRVVCTSVSHSLISLFNYMFFNINYRSPKNI